MLVIAPLALLAFAAVANAQAVGQNDIPAACGQDCSQTLQVSTLCSEQYQDSTDLSACFCNALPSDLSSCATCLTGQNLAETAAVLTEASSSCPAAIKACAFSCDFEACDPTDLACQCAGGFLQNVLNCASCNAEQGNTGVTLVSDYETLATSCRANNFEAPTEPQAIPSPTGQDQYVAPTLASSAEAVASTDAAVSSVAAQTTNVVGSAITSAASSASAAASSASSSARSSSSSSRLSSSVRASSSASAAGASQSVIPGSGAEKVLATSGALGFFALIGLFL